MDATTTQQGLTLFQQICVYAAPPLVTAVGWFVSRYISKTDASITEHAEKFDKFEEKYHQDQEIIRKKMSSLASEVRKDMHTSAMTLVGFQKELNNTMREAQTLMTNLKQEYSEQRRVLNMLTEMRERVEILTMEVQDVKELPEKVAELKTDLHSVDAMVHDVKKDQEKGRIFIIEETKRATGKIILIEDLQKRHSQALSGAAQALKMHRKELDDLKRKKKDEPSGSGHG